MGCHTSQLILTSVLVLSIKHVERRVPFLLYIWLHILPLRILSYLQNQHYHPTDCFPYNYWRSRSQIPTWTLRAPYSIFCIKALSLLSPSSHLSHACIARSITLRSFLFQSSPLLYELLATNLQRTWQFVIMARIIRLWSCWDRPIRPLKISLLQGLSVL